MWIKTGAGKFFYAKAFDYFYLFRYFKRLGSVRVFVALLNYTVLEKDMVPDQKNVDKNRDRQIFLCKSF